MEDNGHFIKTLFNKYAIPIIITIFVSIGGGVVNAVMAGNYFGSGGLAVIGICSPATYLFYTLGALIGIGAATNATRFIGRDDYDGVNALYSTSLTLTALIGIIISISGRILALKIAGILTDSAELLPDVHRYLVAYIPFGVFVMLQYTVAHFARIDGKPNAGMYMFAVMIVLNVAFNFIFAGVLGLGVESIALGSGIATVGANISGFIFLSVKRSNLKLRKPKFAYTRDIAVAGSPPSFSNLFMLLRTFILNGLLMSLGGERPVAVFSVISSVTAIATAAVYGIGQTLIPLAGILNEEKDYVSIRQIVKRAFLIGGVITTAFSFGAVLLGGSITSLYGIKEPEIRTLFGTAMPYLAASLIFSVANILFTYYYMAVSRFGIANILTFARELLFAVLLAYGFSKVQGVHGVWISLLFVEIAAIVVILAYSTLTALKNRNISMLFMFDKRLETEGRYISFSIDNNQDAITEASRKICEFCEKNKLNAKQSMLISMSIEEIVTLIVNNSMNKGTYNTVAVRVFILDDMIILRLRNSGEKFNPIEYYNRTISVDFEKGLEVIGLKYIVGASNAIHYRETFGINNLTIVL